MTLNLFPNPDYSPPSATTNTNTSTRAPFVCPLSFKEMSGTVPFIALRHCGCVFSDSAVRGIIPRLTRGVGIKALPKEVQDEKPDEAKAVTSEGEGEVACPSCGKLFDPTLPTAIAPINPPREVQDELLEHLLTTRATSKSNKKRKATTATAIDGVPMPTKTKTKMIKEEGVNGTQDRKLSKSASGSPAPGSGAAARKPMPTANTLAKSVHQKLADQEAKRLIAHEGMSDAVKSMFKSKEPDQRGTGGAADFFGRTFNRVSPVLSFSMFMLKWGGLIV